eukprot:scaffold161184_cov23-Prasinocladus_malaysianus.AAC.1
MSWRWVPQNQNEDTVVSRQWRQVDKTALKPAIILMHARDAATTLTALWSPPEGLHAYFTV